MLNNTSFKILAACFTIFSFVLISCDKDPVNQEPLNYKLRYSDSIFYLKSGNYEVAPLTQASGTYEAFPDDLNIDPATGKITISVNGKGGQHSQMGLRYKIKFTSNSGQKDSTYIILSGINYQDRIYNMTQADSKISPIYNADISKNTPGGIYTADRNKLAINAATGEIDFKQTVANGFFGGDPTNDDWREVEISYKPNDASTKTNKINLIVYYYDTVNDIPSNVSTVMRAHQSQLLGIPEANIPVTTAPVDASVNDLVSITRPRPPCIIIVGH